MEQYTVAQTQESTVGTFAQKSNVICRRRRAVSGFNYTSSKSKLPVLHLHPISCKPLWRRTTPVLSVRVISICEKGKNAIRGISKSHITKKCLDFKERKQEKLRILNINIWLRRIKNKSNYFVFQECLCDSFFSLTISHHFFDPSPVCCVCRTLFRLKS